MLVPNSDTNIVNSFLGSGELFIIQNLDLDNGINSLVRLHLEILSLFNHDMDHVVSALHGADTLLLFTFVVATCGGRSISTLLVVALLVVFLLVVVFFVVFFLVVERIKLGQH